MWAGVVLGVLAVGAVCAARWRRLAPAQTVTNNTVAAGSEDGVVPLEAVSSPEWDALRGAPMGSTVTLTGIAENHKVGAALSYDGHGGIYVLHPQTHWPVELVGVKVRVTGILQELHDLPVFIADPADPSIQGMPRPVGTDLEEASKRVVIAEPTWVVVK